MYSTRPAEKSDGYLQPIAPLFTLRIRAVSRTGIVSFPNVANEAALKGRKDDLQMQD